MRQCIAVFLGVVLYGCTWIPGMGAAGDDIDSQNFTEYSESIPGSDVSIPMVPVHGGTFVMGDASKDASNTTEVSVGSFWMSSHEISWEQYNHFVEQKNDQIEELLKEDSLEHLAISVDAVAAPSQPYLSVTHGMPIDGYPAVSMTHYAAVAYAKWLSAMTGRFYRLPTEAEWEYACRGGSGTASYIEIDSVDLEQELLLKEYEWYAGNTDQEYGPYATKKPNPYGLYDMMGNVAEWTMDQYIEDYHDKLGDDLIDQPWFPVDKLYPRAVRGGSWQDQADEIRCTTRRGSDGSWSRSDPQLPRSLWWHSNAPFVGLRLVRPLKTPSPDEIEQYWVDPVLDY